MPWNKSPVFCSQLSWKNTWDNLNTCPSTYHISEFYVKNSTKTYTPSQTAQLGLWNLNHIKKNAWSHRSAKVLQSALLWMCIKSGHPSDRHVINDKKTKSSFWKNCNTEWACQTTLRNIFIFQIGNQMLKANKEKIQSGLKTSPFSSHFDVKKLHLTLCITPVLQDCMYKTKHSSEV